MCSVACVVLLLRCGLWVFCFVQLTTSAEQNNPKWRVCRLCRRCFLPFRITSLPPPTGEPRDNERSKICGFAPLWLSTHPQRACHRFSVLRSSYRRNKPSGGNTFAASSAYISSLVVKNDSMPLPPMLIASGCFAANLAPCPCHLATSPVTTQVPTPVTLRRAFSLPLYFR